MPTLKSQIGALAQKEMDRKDFLKYGGSVVLAAIGVTGLLRVVLGLHTHGQTTDNKQTDGGYGSSAYGR